MSLTLEQYEAAMKPLRRTSAYLNALRSDAVWDLRPDHWLFAEVARMRSRRRSMRRRRGHTYDRAGRPL